MTWIPVSERIPEKNRPVLVGCPKDGIFPACVGIAHRLARVRPLAWKFYSVRLAFRVTHWQPLPLPPAEKDRS